MATKETAQSWLRPYLGSVPFDRQITRRTTLSYSPSTPLIAKSGVFSINFGDIKSPATAKTVRTPNNFLTDIYTLTISRMIGFYGVRLEANGFQSWYSKDAIKTPIERFYWGLVSFDADNACVRQINLKQSRQIIILPELLGIVSGLLSVGENVDLRERVSPLLPSRLSGFIYWEDMAAEASFFGVSEEWVVSWDA